MKKKIIKLERLQLAKDKIVDLTQVKASIMGGGPKTSTCTSVGCPINISNQDTSPCTTVHAPCESVNSCEQSFCQNMPPCATNGC